MPKARNVLGTELQLCSEKPLTGFTRNGCCDNIPGDNGLHIVCVKVTSDFLAFSKKRGNDLSTPVPEYMFPGLKPGDRWCLCASRWREAYDAGVAPEVVLEATHVSMLEFASLEELKQVAG
ncbi:DUF2237 domain-containing protein [Telmatocola sphagniphila]|jgi:uncharacterized protein (DUF2237 family)|uniref:DUF2237 domain-containing protein n=1 Tax=Telmatocola sphagniphila TaxID=1123043 RepID=A0A8E6B573_9BACT|nr:DUF2237 domain-containing protein [Telmatocola sphagniphila]QVL31577.1 DUF2237 domain-containing protein [Telmatocola sphagniphila]